MQITHHLHLVDEAILEEAAKDHDRQPARFLAAFFPPVGTICLNRMRCSLTTTLSLVSTVCAKGVAMDSAMAGGKNGKICWGSKQNSNGEIEFVYVNSVCNHDE